LENEWIYAVESCCEEQQQLFRDVVVARDEEHARGQVAEVRDYAGVCEVERIEARIDTLKDDIRALESFVGKPDIVRRSWEEFVDEITCSEDVEDDGEFEALERLRRARRNREGA